MSQTTDPLPQPSTSYHPFLPSPNACSCLSQETSWGKDIVDRRCTSSIGTAILWHANGQGPGGSLSTNTHVGLGGGKEAKGREFNSRSASERGLSSSLPPRHPCAQLSVR